MSGEARKESTQKHCRGLTWTFAAQVITIVHVRGLGTVSALPIASDLHFAVVIRVAASVGVRPPSQ
jgi:hypothetical protein